MKLLFDQHLSLKLAKKLGDVFPGSNQVKLVGMHEAEDDEIWEYARAHGFTVVSKDSDYNESQPTEGDNADVGPAIVTDLKNDLFESLGSPF